jgi:hypothetical protein
METNEVKVEKEDGKVKKLEKQMNGMCAVLRKLKSECEKHWGIDIDGDGKIGSIRMNALLLLLCVGVVAAVMAGDLVNYPTPSGGVGFSVDDSGNATVGGTLTVSGATSISTISATTVAATAAITLTDSDSNAVVTVTGFELSDASLVLDADQGDDNADTWTLKSVASDNDLDIINHTTTIASLTAAGNLRLYNGEFFDNATADGVVYLAGDSDEAAITFNIESRNTSNGDAILQLTADGAGDNADSWRLLNDADDSNWLEFDNYTSGSWANKLRISTDGVLEVATINELGSAGVVIEGMTMDDGVFTDVDGTLNMLNVVATGEVTVDGKYAVVGKDATTGIMVLGKAVTSTAATTQTNAFDTVFGAAPVVTCTYTENPVSTNVIYITSITVSNFVCEVVADVNFNYIAVGTRP